MIGLAGPYQTKPASATPVKPKVFDTAQIDRIRFPVYPEWKGALSEKYRLDSTYNYDPAYLRYFRTRRLHYGVASSQDDIRAVSYMSPLFFQWVYNKEKAAVFLKQAPKGGFNSVLSNKDTLSFVMRYLRQANAEEYQAMVKNMDFAKNDALVNIYRKYGIETRRSNLKTPEAIKANQDKMMKLYDSAYMIQDTVTLQDGKKLGLLGVHESYRGQKGTSFTLYGFTTYKIWGGYVSFQIFASLNINKKIKMTIAERKKWAEYLKPILANMEFPRESITGK